MSEIEKQTPTSGAIILVSDSGHVIAWSEVFTLLAEPAKPLAISPTDRPTSISRQHGATESLGKDGNTSSPPPFDTQNTSSPPLLARIVSTSAELSHEYQSGTFA